MFSVMVVEDEKLLRDEICVLLTQNGYRVTAPEEFSDILKRVEQERPDLILLDIGLEHRNGKVLCTKIREKLSTPIIFVTGQTSPMDELECLTRGGDDFIEKPYQAPLLLAHIQAVLRRYHPGGEEKSPEHIRCKGLSLLIPEGQMEYEGKRAELTKNEMKILYCLFTHENRFVPRADLIEYLWDNEVFIDDNTLSVNMTRIRGKMKEIGAGAMIQTKRGMGYRI